MMTIRFRLHAAVPSLLLVSFLLSGCLSWRSKALDLTASGEKASRFSDRQKSEFKFGLALAVEQQGDLPRAIAGYREVLGHDPKHREALHRLAVSYDRLEEYGQSAEFFEKALKLQPGDPQILCDIGYSYYKQRRWADAEAVLKEAIRNQPNHTRAHNNLGLVLAQADRSREAFAEFRKSGNPTAQAHMNLAHMMTMEGRLDQAQQQYNLALDANPASKDAQKRRHELNLMVAKIDSSAQRANKTQQIAANIFQPQPNTRARQTDLPSQQSQFRTQSTPIRPQETDYSAFQQVNAEVTVQPRAAVERTLTDIDRIADSEVDDLDEFDDSEIREAQSRLAILEFQEYESDINLSEHSTGIRYIQASDVSGEDKLSDGSVHLDQLQGLYMCEKLDLAYPEISDEELEELEQLPNLQMLSLSGTAITDDGLRYLQRLPRLTALRLNDTDVTDVGIKHLIWLPHLELVDLRNTQVTTAGIDRLEEALPDVKILY